MDASEQSARSRPAQRRQPPAQYRLNRKAALALGLCFALAGLAVGAAVLPYLNPERRLGQLRESAAEYARRGDWPRAQLQWSNVVQLCPDDAAAWHGLGVARLQQARTSEDPTRLRHVEAAAAAFRRAVALDPDRVDTQRWLLELALRAGAWPECRERLAALEARLPVGDSLLQTARGLIPTQFPVEAARAAALLEAEQPRAALAAAATKLSQAPADLSLLRPAAVAWTHCGDYAARDAALARAEQLLGNAPGLRLVRAECALASRRLPEAAAWLRGDVPPPLAAAAWRLQARLAECRAEAQPADRQAWRNRAVAAYRELLKVSPADVAAGNNAAWLLGELGRVEEGLEVSTETLSRALEPSARLWDTHGWLLHKSGRSGEAVDFLARAVALAPRDPGPRLRWAEALDRLGRRQEAQEQWRIAAAGPVAEESPVPLAHARLARSLASAAAAPAVPQGNP